VGDHREDPIGELVIPQELAEAVEEVLVQLLDSMDLTAELRDGVVRRCAGSSRTADTTNCM